jgi:signal transduction histidine kinase
MPRSPLSASILPGVRSLWPVVLTLALLAQAASVVPIWRVNPGAAVAFGVVAVAILALMGSLRRSHLAALAEVVRRENDIRARDDAAKAREVAWQARVDAQVERMREEIEFTLQKRLPAVFSHSEVPPPLHGAEQIGVATTEGLDRLLSWIADEFDNREESRRLGLVELASRVQSSAHRIQAEVTALPQLHFDDHRTRADLEADLLEISMKVDHAATQQARHAQSLKVLCGEWPGQQWQKPMALVDAARAASGRIVAFQRIEVSGDPDVGVTPSVLEPLIHLVAELLANATEYSPPKTPVRVTVRTVQRGAVIEVEDSGLGLDEYRLAEAQEIVSGRQLLGIAEIGEIPRTGFAVVGRFADRHGFRVDLGHSPYGGVRAVALIPSELLEILAPAVTRPVRAVQSVPPPAPAEAVPDGPAATPAQSASTPALPVRAESAPDAAPRTDRQLPQRRSRRGEYDPAPKPAPAATPPATPEEAGDWMERFFEGSVSPVQPDSTAHEGQGPTTTDSESPEGQNRA